MDYRELWKALRYPGLDLEYIQRYRYELERTAEKILEFLANESVGLIAPAGSGKTIVAILVALARGGRNVFCVPFEYLTDQQHFVMQRMGITMPTRAVDGSTIPVRRTWETWNEQIFFVTPGVIVNDLKSGKLIMDASWLLTLDELDLARGDYPYVELAQLCAQRGVRTLGLTATLDERYERPRQVLRDCRITRVIHADFDMPPLTESKITLPLTKELALCRDRLKGMLVDNGRELQRSGIHIDPEVILTIAELDDLSDRHERADHKRVGWKSTKSALARYYKLRHAYVTALTGTYHSFIRFAKKLEVQAATTEEWRGNMAAQKIIIDARFKRALKVARGNLHDHPKLRWLLKVAESHARMHRPFLVYTNLRETTEYYAEQLNWRGICAEAVFGGRSNRKRLLESVQRLRDGKLLALVSTSVLDRGLNLPEIRTVINLSMPQTKETREQRGGRANRLQSGSSILVAIDDPIDTLWFWVTKTYPMKPELPATVRWLLGTPPRKGERPRRRKQRDTATLPLFEAYA